MLNSIVDNYKFSTDEMLFVDDKSNNIDVAIKMGFHTCLVKDGNTAKEVLGFLNFT